MAAGTNGFVKLLIDQGILGKDQVLDAQNMAKQTGEPIAVSLVKLGYATDSEVMVAQATYHKMEYVDLQKVEISEDIIELMPESVARENIVLPMNESDGRLKVLISDPSDVETIEKLRFILNRDVTPALATRSQISEFINRFYGQVEGESADSILQEFTDTAIDFTETVDDSESSGDDGVDENSAPIVRLVQLMITCLLYTSPSPRDLSTSRMPSSA